MSDVAVPGRIGAVIRTDRFVRRRPPGTAEIVRLGTPMMAASLATAAAQVVVVAMLGHLSDSALYVRSAFTPVLFAFLALGEALSASTQVSAALAAGRGERQGAGRAGTFLALGLFGFSAAAGVTALLAPALTRFLQVPVQETAGVVSFTRWMAVASIPIALPLVTAAALRGTGRVRQGALVTVTYLVLDLGGVGVLGYGLGWGVLSVAWSSGAAAIVAGALGAAFLVRAGVWAGLPRRRAVSHTSSSPLRMLAVVGAPVAASYAVLFVSGLLLLRVLRGYGTAVVSGFTVGYSIQTLAVVPAIALGSATAIHINRLRGAGRGAEAAAGFSPALWLGIRLYVFLGVAVTALAAALPPLITTNPAAADTGRQFLLVAGPGLIGLGLVVLALTLLEQIGSGAIAFGFNALYVALVAGVGAQVASSLDSPLGLYVTLALVPVVGAPVVLAVTRRRVGNLRAVQPSPQDPGMPALRCLPARDAALVEVAELFEDPGFLFKTYLPRLTDLAGIQALLTAETRLLTVENRVIGLAEFEDDAGEHCPHVQLHLRLRADVPATWWPLVLEALVAAERDDRDIVRLSMRVYEFDDRGTQLASECGFVHEGLLPGVIDQGGTRHGVHTYARFFRAPTATSAARPGVLAGAQ